MPTKKNKTDGIEVALNSAIAISGVILLGFLYSFSQNQLHDGVEIKPTITYDSSQPILAKDVYIQNPVEDIKVEVLNGCGVSALALKTTEFLRTKQIDVINSDNADNHNYQNTLLILRNEKLDAIELIRKSFGIAQNNDTVVQTKPDESLGVDLTIIIGKDIHTYSNIFDFIASKN